MPPIDRPNSAAMQRLEQANTATATALLRFPESAPPDEAREALEKAARELAEAIENFLFERRGGITPWRAKDVVGALGTLEPVANDSNASPRASEER